MEDPTASSRLAAWLWTAAVFAAAMVLVFSISVRRKVDIDEHAFITSGAILRDGVLPYRDYHYNHMPTQVIVYSLLFRLTDRLLLAARLFQTICAAVLAAAIFRYAWNAFELLGTHKQRLYSLLIALFFIAHPLYNRTAGLSWNHDFPTLMMVASFLTVVAALRRGGAIGAGLAMIAGALAGLSVTGRLTFAPALLPLVLLVLLFPQWRWRGRIGMLVLSAIGFTLACLPSAWVWAQAPADAWFGNFVYPQYNTAFHSSLHDARPMSFLGIVVQYFKSWFTLPGNGITAVWLILLSISTLRFRAILKDGRQCELFAYLLAAVMLVAAGCMPAPTYPQYFYAATPFMMLGLVICLAGKPRLFDDKPLRLFAMASIAVSVGFAVWQYRGLPLLLRVNAWTPTRAHAIGREIARASGPGKVLTMESVYAVEGGLDVYPELTTSRFVLRAAPFLSEPRRKRYKMILPRDFEGWFQTRPPAAIVAVLRTDKHIEDVEESDAKKNGYQRIFSRTFDEGFLWVRPPPK
jgi:hypothetical protein